MTLLIHNQSACQPQKPKKRIIRKKKSKEEPKDNGLSKVNKVVTFSLDSNNTKPKKRKIIRKSNKVSKSEINTEPSLSLPPVKDENKNIDSGSEDDVECVFTVCWYHRNNSYLLDENTQEVFSKKDHSLLGLRYINDDELSVIDFDYANYND
jgi:hypothetical protein